MITRYGAWLDNLPLSGIDPTIIITDIDEHTPAVDVLTASRALGDGLRVTRRTRQSLSVAVKFMIREYGVARRKDILQRVITWARLGKYLSISDRPGQRLRVELDSVPTITSALKWTSVITLTFIAYACPFWEEDTPVTRTGGGKMYVPGDAEKAFVDVSIQPTSSNVTVKAGDTSITLQGVSGKIDITHEDGVLRIMSGSTSLLSKRTAASSDDLWVTPGQENTFSISGGTATFSVRGVWL